MPYWAGLCQVFAGGEGKGNLAADNPRTGTASGERRGSSLPRAGCRSAWTSASVAHPKCSSRAAVQPAVCCLQTSGKQLLGRAKAVGELLLRAVRAASLCYADLVCSSCLEHFRSCKKLSVESAVSKLQHAISKHGSRMELAVLLVIHSVQIQLSRSSYSPVALKRAELLSVRSCSAKAVSCTAPIYAFFSILFICITVAPKGPKWDQGNAGWRLCT